MRRWADREFRERIYRAVRAIPPGRVASYGDIAHLAGAPRHARQVGRALRALSPELAGTERAAPGCRAAPGRPPGGPDDGADDGPPAGEPVPWHRVVNARGRVSRHPDPEESGRQIARLRAEGVEVGDDGALAGGLAAYGWWPEAGALDDLPAAEP